MSLFLLVTREGTGIMTSTKLAEMHELGKNVPFFVNKVSTYFCQKISTMNWQRIRMRGGSADCTLDGPPPPTSVSLVEIYYYSRDKSMSALSHKSKVRCKQIHEEERRRGLMAK